MTLTEFLLARITEDEAAAPFFDNGGPCHECGGSEFGRARVLAECEAKRQQVEHYQRISVRFDGGPLVLEEYVLAEGAVRKQLQFMAAVYADHPDHPDYQPEWRP